MTMIVANRAWVPLGYARFADLSSAVTIGSDAPTAGTAFSALATPPRHAIISIEAQSVRVRDDGTDPTTTEGELCTAGTKLSYEGSTDGIKKFTAIETTAGAAMTVRYYA